MKMYVRESFDAFLSRISLIITSKMKMSVELRQMSQTFPKVNICRIGRENFAMDFQPQLSAPSRRKCHMDFQGPRVTLFFIDVFPCSCWIS